MIFLTMNNSIVQAMISSAEITNISGRILRHFSKAVKKSFILMTAAQLCTLYFRFRLMCCVTLKSNVHWAFKLSF